MIPNILSIAGSDPSGGAGIQADLKAISARGGYGMAALTALTAQNTRGVRGVELVAPDFVALQIRAVFEDIDVAAVKIGMLGSAAIARAVADTLEDLRPRVVVLDPVMVAKGGDRLLDEDAVAVLRDRLLPLADAVTPNLPEAAVLTGAPEPSDRRAMEEVAAALRGMGPPMVVLKGGHLGGETSPDLVLDGAGPFWLEAARVPTRHTHGTGCSLSAALATELARTPDDPRAAARAAKAFVAAAIARADALSVGQGHGPIHHFHAQQSTP